MRLLLVILLLITAGVPVTAQPVKYTYDTAGNRVSRTKVINMTTSMVKSSAGEPGAEEAAAEVPKFEDALEEMKIVIYPNPTRGILRIDIKGATVPHGGRVVIFNVAGNIVRQWNNIGITNTVDISGQPAGTYFLQIIFDKDKKSVWKIIKE